MKEKINRPKIISPLKMVAVLECKKPLLDDLE